MYDAIIIGGGAGGLMCASAALARGKRILVLEANDRVGKKLLATGNGKCNLSNTYFDSSCYNSSFPQDILSMVDTKKLISVFEELGLKTKTVDGRVYPYSESAASVLDVLRKNTESYTNCSCFVNSLEEKDGIFAVNGEFLAKKIVLATGSNAAYGRGGYRLYEKFGHRFGLLRPSLVNLICDTKNIRALSGLRAKVKVTLLHGGKNRAEETGEIQFKDDGVSGICVMNLSKIIANENGKDYSLSVDFIPDMDEKEAERYPVAGIVRRVLAETVLHLARQRNQSAYHILKNFVIPVKALGDRKNAQVISGGLDTSQFCSKTLESKLKKGLFAIGETLDVDGKCGGYNLHWSFAGGLVVANAI